jgi:hypothetical protein
LEIIGLVLIKTEEGHGQLFGQGHFLPEAAVAIQPEDFIRVAAVDDELILNQKIVGKGADLPRSLAFFKEVAEVFSVRAELKELILVLDENSAVRRDFEVIREFEKKLVTCLLDPKYFLELDDTSGRFAKRPGCRSFPG